MYFPFLNLKAARCALADFTIRHTEELVFWVRADGSFAFVSRPVVELLGYSIAEWNRLRVPDILTDYDDAERDRLRERIDAAGRHHVRANLRCKDGTTRTVEAVNNRVEAYGETFNVSFCRLLYGGGGARRPPR